MIRTSDIGANKPTRQVSAQRYQAAVAPKVPNVSGLEKLAEFGMGAMRVKHEMDKEVLQADMSIATDNYEAAVKAMDPAEFVKNPDEAIKAAGIDKMYALIEDAPIGTQGILRKKIDAMAVGTKAAMETAHTARETTRSAVYNTSTELRETGSVAPEHWDVVMSLNGDAQKHAVSSLAQIAITEGHVSLFDQMANDKRLSPELQDQVEIWKRQASDRITAKQRETEALARRRRHEAEKAAKENLKAQSRQSAIQLVNAGLPIEYVMSLDHINSGVKRDELEGLIRSDPALHQKVAAHSVLQSDKALMTAGLQNPVAPDGKTPAPHFIMAAKTLEGYKAVRGSWEALEGVGITKRDVTLLDAAELTKLPHESFQDALFRTMVSVPKFAMPFDQQVSRKLDNQHTEGMSLSQKATYSRVKETLMALHVPLEKAAETAMQKATEGAKNVGGLVISDFEGIKNGVNETLGIDATPEAVEDVINTTIDSVLGNASQAFYGVNKPLNTWRQYAATDGALVMQSLDDLGLMISITPEQFKKTASAKKTKDVTYGKPEDTRRVDHPDRYHTVGAGYPIRSY